MAPERSYSRRWLFAALGASLSSNVVLGYLLSRSEARRAELARSLPGPEPVSGI